MPKAKELTHRFTVRVPKFLADEIHKFTLDNDLDYSELFRLALSKYLRENIGKVKKNGFSQSATKKANSSVPDVSLFGVTSPHDDDDDYTCWSGDSDHLGLN